MTWWKWLILIVVILLGFGGGFFYMDYENNCEAEAVIFETMGK